MKRLLTIAARVVSLIAIGCGGASTPSRSPASAEPNLIPRAAAAAICPLAQNRLSGFALSHGAARDTYVWVLDCQATPKPAGVSIDISAAVWLALKSDAAGVLVDQFVQATVSVSATYAIDGSYVNDHAELTLRPITQARVDVVPVGTVGVEPLNWATLAANVFAPKLGTTSEWVVKDLARKQALSVMTAAIDQTLQIDIDARRDRVAQRASHAEAAPAKDATEGHSVIVAPRGTALAGPFDAAQIVSIGDDMSRKSIVAKAMCARDVDALLARDRRGDRVDLGEWRTIPAEGGAFDPGACAWWLALRVTDTESHLAALRVRADTASPPRDLETVWAAIHDIHVIPTGSENGLQIWVSGGDDKVRIYPLQTGSQTPPVFAIGSGGTLVIDAIEAGTTERLARARAPVSGPPERTVILRNDDAVLATVTFKLTVVSAPLGNAVRP